MTLLWQYGSNMNQARLNSPQRLGGKAQYVGLAIKRGYKLGFPRRDRKKIGTAGIVEGRKDDLVIGALYEVPDDCLELLDTIEGIASGSYRRSNDFEVEAFSGNLEVNKSRTVKAVTYRANPKPGKHPTSAKYANHILRGILDYAMPRDYFEKIKETILKNNPHLSHELISFECPFCRFRVKFTTTHFSEGKGSACEAWIDFEYDEEGMLAWYAILSGNQYTTGHSIVVLSTHRRRITDQSLTDEEAASIVLGATRVARRLKEVLDVPAVHVLSLCEGVDHLHFHLIPRGEYTTEDRMFHYRTFWDREVGEATQFTVEGLARQREFKDSCLGSNICGMWYAGWKESQYKNTPFWKQTEEDRVKSLEDLAGRLRRSQLQSPFRECRIRDCL